MTQRKPSAWVDDPRISQAARRVGWERHTGDLTLLEAMIFVESKGDSAAVSGDGCYGLGQFKRSQKQAYDQQFRGVLRQFGPLEISRNAPPENSLIYGGVVMQDSMRVSRYYEGRRGEGYADNLYIATRGYNGGPSLMRPFVRNMEANDYPGSVASYLLFQAYQLEGTPEGERFAAAFQRMERDANRVGAGDHFRENVIGGRRMDPNNPDRPHPTHPNYGFLGFIRTRDFQVHGGGDRPIDGLDREDVTAIYNRFSARNARAPEVTRAQAPADSARSEQDDITRAPGSREERKQFQRALGVDDDGVWGRDTQRAFLASGADTDGNGRLSRAEFEAFISPVRQALRGDHHEITAFNRDPDSQQRQKLRGIQLQLKEAGHYTGEIDGIWGPLMAKAWKASSFDANRDGMISYSEMGDVLAPPPTPPRAPAAAPERDGGNPLLNALRGMIGR